MENKTETKREEAERLWNNQGVPHKEIEKRLSQIPDNEVVEEKEEGEVKIEDEKKNLEDSSGSSLESSLSEVVASEPASEVGEVTKSE